MQKWYPVFVLLLGSMLGGCLGDNVSVEVKPRLILQPPYVKFKAEGTGDLVAQWGPSITDTQSNFKGYYIELYTSIADEKDPEIIDSTVDLVATAHVPKSDTSYVFKNITPGRYTLKVYGERFPDPDIDTIVLSKFAALYSFSFDPTPVLAPAELRAHSVGQGNVTVSWNPSPTVSQAGMVGYIIRYRDKTTSGAKTFTHSRPGKGLTSQEVSIQFPLTNEALELPYLIWIKGLRNDSTESVDSAIIEWSGARALGTSRPSIEIGKRLFIGQTNIGYEMKQLDDPKAQIGVNAVDSVVTIEAFEGAKFVNRVDTATFDMIFFNAPFPDAAFTETSLTLPRNPASDVWFYVLFQGGARARVVFFKDVTSGTLIHGANAIRTEAKFQPGGPPHFLPYF